MMMKNNLLYKWRQRREETHFDIAEKKKKRKNDILGKDQVVAKRYFTRLDGIQMGKNRKME